MDTKGIGDLLHPVRIQVLKALAKDKELTTRELSVKMPDVPQASLYRHLRVMLASRILEVSQETQVRGTTERSYRLKAKLFDDIAALTSRLDKDDLLDLFTSFLLAQLSDLAEYLGEDEYPAERERIRFFSESLYLDDTELKSFMNAIDGVVKEYARIEAGPGRRLHKSSFTLIPTRIGPKEAGGQD